MLIFPVKLSKRYRYLLDTKKKKLIFGSIRVEV